MEKEGLVKWFSELSNKDISIAGGKGASLAEMYNFKFPIPPGFVITAQAYAYFIEHAGLKQEIDSILEHLDIEDTKVLQKASEKIRSLIENAKLPKDLEEEIIEAYDILDVDKQSLENVHGHAKGILKNSHEPPFVAVRSSATTEDLADASFAGQQDSYVNVKGHVELIRKVKQCFSSLFNARAIYYRIKKGFGNSSYLAVVVQKMIDSDKSGVMFSRNPVKHDNNVVIEAVWGLGEGIVSGRIKPDHYMVGRDDETIKETKVNEKKSAIVRDSSGKTTVVKLTSDRATQQVLSNYEIKRLASYGMELEKHYGKPQDIEFCISKGELFIVQSRPITTLHKEQQHQAASIGSVLLSGLGASPGVGTGPVKIIHDESELSKVMKGDVLVTEMTNPDMVIAMERASAIVTNEGGITSHAAIVSREMGIPAVVGTGSATETLHDGQMITVDGNIGKVLEGKGETKEVEILPVVPTKTKIKVIVDLPEYAERAALSKATSVGLVRLEGIIGRSGKHPLHFVNHNKINDYIEVVYKGLHTIATPFKEIWVRTSDIRSDEYRNLEGSPKLNEGNPMLGDHGIRYSLKHPEILKAEISAAFRVANTFPDKKIGIMMPQVISVDEVRRTKELARELGIPSNVVLGIMVETPAAVQIINELCEEGINFISFGTNDLTQYTLALDRNNTEVQDLYTEMHPAVLNSLRYVIRKCRKYGVESSLCGQAGSREDMARFLVGEGIDSISVNADAAHKVSSLIAEIEKEQKKEERKEESASASPPPLEMQAQPVRAFAYNSDDIEDVVIHELEKSEYSPSGAEKNDIPLLNDAMSAEEEKPVNELREDRTVNVF
ncbi:phosphoenolpyruvate synthase [Candidatus Pacearchaeota archaeon]|nr:phosphoenolpyruvate synthase [Candidatus Pacearchaeota archaeon]